MASRIHHAGKKGARPRKRPSDLLEVWLELFKKIEGPRRGRETELRRRFGNEPGFHLAKIPGAWKHGEIPACFEPVEFGSFFVSFAKP